jgi:RHS repeat-associated protein
VHVPSVLSGILTFALIGVGTVAPSSGPPEPATTPELPFEVPAPDVWVPDADPAEPSPGGAPPSRPWAPGDEEPSARASESFSAASVPPVPTGVGDRSSYTFEEFSLSADPGFEAIKVNVGSGNLFVRSKVAELAGPGVPAVAYQVYNSLHNQNSGELMGPWFNDFAMTGLIVSASEVRYFDGTGSEWQFTKSGSTWVSPPGANASLAQLSNGQWRLTYNRTGERITFNSYGWAITRQDRNGVGITYGWDSIGHLVSITDAVGKQVSVTRNSSNQLTALSAAGRSTTFDYHATNKRLLSVVNGGRTATYTQPTSDHVRTITRDGRTLTFAYDTTGRATSVTLARSGETSLVTSFAYTSTTTTVTDPRGNDVVYHLDSQDRVVKVVDQNGRERAQTWTANSDVATTTDAFATGGGQGNVTTATYDQLNNTTGIVLPTGAATQALYAQGPNCQTAQSGHPYLPKCAIDDAGNHQSYTYDSAGNVTKVKDATTGGTGAEFSYTYENATGSLCGGVAGQVCTATDGNGKVTSYAYTNGNLTTVTPPAPLGSTSYSYDAVGRVTSVTDGNGDTTTYAYDAADRVTQTTYDNGQSQTTGYNQDGTISSEYDPAAGHISYGYNILGKQNYQNTYPLISGGLGGTLSMTYDASGNLTSHNETNGITTYAYDDANQLISVTEPGGTCPTSGYPAPGSGCTKFDYDQNGAEKTRIFPGAARIDTTRDDSGRITRVRARDGGGTTRVDIGYDYTTNNEDRTLVQRRISTKEQGVPAGAVSTYTYDSLQRLTRALEKNGSTTNATFSYQYDDAGNRTQQTQTGAVGSARAGNLSYVYNAANQITSTSADIGSWTYDGAGNEIRNGLTNSTRTYGDRGQVTNIDGQNTISFGLGNQRTMAAGTYRFQLSPLGTSHHSNSGNHTYTNRTPDGLPLSTKTAAATNYFVTDHLGSVVGLFTATGTWAGGYSYTPYGERRFTASGLTSNNWRYAGTFEQSANLYKMGARYYDAATGRFTQMDPTGQEPNPYTYAQANPCNNIDRSGTMSCSLAVSLVGYGHSTMWGLIGLAAGIGIAGPAALVAAAIAVGYVAITQAGFIALGQACDD